MASKKEIEKFIEEKLMSKNAEFNAGKVKLLMEKSAIKVSAIKVLDRNKELLVKNKEVIDIVAKIHSEMLDCIFKNLFDKQISEIVRSKEFVEKFASDSTIEEAIECGVIPDDLKVMLELLKRIGVHVEVKKVQIE